MLICYKISQGIIRSWTVPYWLRIVLSLSPFVPVVVLVVLKKIRGSEKVDELFLHIHRDAAVLAFNTLFLVLICAHLLEEGGVLVGFVWKTDWLIGAMVATIAAGQAWVGRRYR
jgi:hypothetical protein